MKPLIKYAFAALLLAASTFSYSSTYWEVGGTGVYGTSLDSLCSQHMSGNYVLVSVISTRGKCQQDPYAGLPSVWIYLRSGTCPSPLVDNGSGQCVDYVEPFDCDASPAVYWSNTDVRLAFEYIQDSNGCYIYPTGVIQVILSKPLNCDLSGCDTIATMEMASSSTPPDAATPSPQPSPLSDDISEIPPVDPVSDDVHLNDDLIKTVDDPTIVNNPDGSTEVTENELTTKTKEQGTIINETPDYIFVKHSSGEVTVIAKNTVTVTNPDGSTTKTVTSNTNVISPMIEWTNIPKDATQNPTVTTSGGGSVSTDLTTVNHYNSGGSLTDSTSTGSSSSQGDSSTSEGDETKEGNCGAPGQPVCKVELEDNSDDYSSQMSDLSSLQSELDVLNSDISDDLSDTSYDYGVSGIANFNSYSFISRYFNMPSSLCSGAINTTIFGRPFIFDPCSKLAPLRDVLSWIFFILTAMTIIKIVFNRRII